MGVDGSPNSLDALVWAIGQAALTGAGVQAVIAWDYPNLAGVEPMTTRADLRVKAQRTIDARLAGAMGTASVNVSSVDIAGHPAEVLLDASVGAELLDRCVRVSELQNPGQPGSAAGWTRSPKRPSWVRFLLTGLICVALVVGVGAFVVANMPRRQRISSFGRGLAATCLRYQPRQ